MGERLWESLASRYDGRVTGMKGTAAGGRSVLVCQGHAGAGVSGPDGSYARGEHSTLDRLGSVCVAHLFFKEFSSQLGVCGRNLSLQVLVPLPDHVSPPAGLDPCGTLYFEQPGSVVNHSGLILVLSTERAGFFICELFKRLEACSVKHM